MLRVEVEVREPAVGAKLNGRKERYGYWTQTQSKRQFYQGFYSYQFLSCYTTPDQGSLGAPSRPKPQAMILN